MAGEVEQSIVTDGSQKPSIEENEARISRGAAHSRTPKPQGRWSTETLTPRHHL